MIETFKYLTSVWWGVFLITIIGLILVLIVSALLYKVFFKRLYDILLALTAILVLSPVLLILIVLGAINMHGNPFFCQLRPGKGEKIFRLIKFRTMSNQKDSDGNLLPDNKRLTKYGKFLRASSLDELPGCFNILFGQMSIVGPRPLLVQYLPLYNEEQRKRHRVRPGLTGLAQVNGRNTIEWEKKFEYDVYYAENVSLWTDIKIFFKTVLKVFQRSGINESTDTTMSFFTGTLLQSASSESEGVTEKETESESTGQENNAQSTSVSEED